MPVYSYSCPKCDKKFDFQKKMVDPHPKVCPLCNYKGELGRVFIAPAITFHGSGFYHTDKVLNEITNPEYQLTEAEQIEYFDEKLKDQELHKNKVFT